MKIVHIEEENFHTKFSKEMWFLIILKVTKKQGVSLSLENTLYGKPERRDQIDPSTSLFTLFMTEMTTGTKHLMLFIKHNVLAVVVFATSCAICGYAAGLASI